MRIYEAHMKSTAMMMVVRVYGDVGWNGKINLCKLILFYVCVCVSARLSILDLYDDVDDVRLDDIRLFRKDANRVFTHTEHRDSERLSCLIK
jgi:hypothetical protein